MTLRQQSSHHMYQPAATERLSLFAVYCSDLAFYVGLVLGWELLIAAGALWLVPWVLTMAAASGPLGDPALPLGGI
jgi:hypothetical protein